MNIKYLIAALIMGTSLSISAQTQSWQWVKAGGSSSDNTNVQPAECKIAGCDAYGNVYAVGWVNGPNMAFDTFSSAGAYSANNINISYLLFSYDCAGNMRWAKQIGDDEGNLYNFGVVTDPQGNTYLTSQFWYGTNGGNVTLYLGDSILRPSNVLTQPYFCMVKYDSLGRLVWFKNFEEDTIYTIHTGLSGPYGLRIGSSGNLWMSSFIDSDYAISPNLHTTLKGKYNVEVDPNTGNILGGYYISNQFFGDPYSDDTYFDLDENENYYESGTMYSGDTLILAGQKIGPDPNQTGVEPFIYSIDKNGGFRYFITNTSYSYSSAFNSCKYDFNSKRLIVDWSLDSFMAFGLDTFRFNTQNFYGSQNVSDGLFAITPNGNISWGKYVTYTNQYLYFLFRAIPANYYSDHTQNNGLIIYNNTDTLLNKYTSSSAYDYTKIISKMDTNGNLIVTHAAHLGNTGGLTGANTIKYGCTDWRGNVYLGGTVTNFFATPADSVVNTDGGSGNFFIAKLGISDCSCPTPGVQFTDAIHGDTVFFYGSSINRRDSIHWHLGDGSSFSGDTLFHVYTSHDSTYTVTAIANSGCGVDSVTKLISVTTGIKPIDLGKTNLYPNPVTNTVNLEVSAPATIGLVYANGASVWNTPIQVNQQGSYVFDMSKYACAMYYFIVQYTNGKTDVMQVVKE
jgi:hypothetical protein